MVYSCGPLATYQHRKIYYHRANECSDKELSWWRGHRMFGERLVHVLWDDSNATDDKKKITTWDRKSNGHHASINSHLNGYRSCIPSVGRPWKERVGHLTLTPVRNLSRICYRYNIILLLYVASFFLVGLHACGENKIACISPHVQGNALSAGQRIACRTSMVSI